MNPRIPEPVGPLITDYLGRVDLILPDFMQGFYLLGSIALGAFDDRFSDIDFIAVVNHACTKDDQAGIRQIHHRIARDFPEWQMDGIYLQAGDLGDLSSLNSNCTTYHGGIVRPSGVDEVNPVTWWILKNRGIALKGPEPADLHFDVDFNQIFNYQRRNLNSYWKKFIQKPSRIAWLFTDSGIQWTVLGVLRQWYTFAEHSIISKTGAGEYALTHFPSEWHPLIREALSLREQNKTSHYRTRIRRALDAFSFLRYVIQTCNAMDME